MDHGIKRGFGMVVQAAVVGVIIAEVVPMLVEQGILPRGLFWWVIPLSIISAISTIDISRWWSFGYLGGVVLGIFFGLPIFMDAGLLSPLDVLVYTGIAVGAVALRVHIHTSGF